MAYKILTVDDSRTIRMIVKKAFAPYDCELFEAENGVEGLAAAAKVNPDLIVLDITMPVMTGIEMLGKLKEDRELGSIPVIMLTALSPQHLLEAVWDYPPHTGDPDLVRAHVRNLRAKLEGSDSSVSFIRTIHGVGYMIAG